MAARTIPPAAVLLDLSRAKVVFVTVLAHSGAPGYAVKGPAAAELMRVVHNVLEDGVHVSPLGKRGTLTVRQREVLQLVAEGLSLKQIAAALHVSVKTVEFHKSALMERLGIRTTAGLTRHAIRQGLIAI